MILFRPVLIYFFENQETGMTAHEDPDDHAAHLNRELMVKLGALCVESATEMVTAISRNLELRQDLLPVWWYAIYCKSPLADGRRRFRSDGWRKTYTTVGSSFW